jgi:hypothetical protein
MSASAKAYYDRFIHNAALAQRIEAALPSDTNWVSVVMFYAAVHLMNAHLATKSNIFFDPQSHRDRDQAMRACPELRDSPSEQRKLKDLSEQVRYDPGFVFQPTHLVRAKRSLGRITSIVEPKVKGFLGLP